jgi:hypothetical protein
MIALAISIAGIAPCAAKVTSIKAQHDNTHQKATRIPNQIGSSQARMPKTDKGGRR